MEYGKALYMIITLKKTNSYIFFGTIVQLIIYSFFFNSFFKANQFEASWQDYLYLSLYIFAFFFLIKHLLQIPLQLFIASTKMYRLNRPLQIIQEVSWIALSLIDCVVYNSQGVHIYDRDVLEVVSTPQIYKVLNITATTYLMLAGALIFFVAIIFLAFTIIDKKVELRFKKIVTLQLIICLFITSLSFNFFHSYSRSQGEVLSLYPFLVLMRKRPSNEPLKLSYDLSEIKNIKFKNRPNIIYILTESLRAEVFNPEAMPKLFKYFSQSNCLSPEYSFSGGHTTVYGVFTGLYGVWGYHFADFKKHLTPSAGIEMLKNNQYKIFGGVSARIKFSTYYQSGYMFNNFDNYSEFVAPSKNRYESDLNLLRWGESIASSQTTPFFLFMFLYSTHANYIYPQEFEHFTPVIEEDFNHLTIMSGDGKEERLKRIYNRYKNSAWFLDSKVDDFLKTIPADTLKNSIVVFSGDHGQEFGEEGAWGHAKTNYINPKIKVPLKICFPADFSVKDKIQKQIQKKITAQADIFPTIIDYALDGENNIIDKYFNGISLLREIPEERYVVITSPLFPYERNKLGIISSEYKFWLKKTTETLDHYYLYRIANLDDQKVLSADYKIVYKKNIDRFGKDAYKFLKRP